MDKAKSQILQRIQSNKPKTVPLPDIPLFIEESFADIETFSASLALSKGVTHVLPDSSTIKELIYKLFPDANSYASTSALVESDTIITPQTDPKDLKDIEVGIVPAQLGVAENGALWVSELDCIHRIFPFIVQHLIILLKRDTIVPNMHHAYRHIQINETGFGVFIAGPSKTADIEQALVIGAHGPRTLHVLIY